jgi:hypothetical protein
MTQDVDDGILHFVRRMCGSNATGMVSDESESKYDNDNDGNDDDVRAASAPAPAPAPAPVPAAPAAPVAVPAKALVQYGSMFYVELKNGKCIALGGKAGLGDNDSMCVLNERAKEKSGGNRIYVRKRSV